MEAILVLCLLFLVIACHVRINTLRDEIGELRRLVEQRLGGQARTSVPTYSSASSAETIPAAAIVDRPAGTADKSRDVPTGTQYPTPEQVRENYARERERLTMEDELRRQAAALEDAGAREEKPARESNFEFQFGKRLPVWIGGVALALSGFYLVKYSIEQGWLTEQVRVILGFFFGTGLLLGARYIRAHKPDMADGVRIAQALAGAGISSLYATFYAAASMYHLIPPFAGLVCMATVTAVAVILSVRHGMPIAVIGMLGGFLTPALIRTEHPSAPMLFFYLFMLVAGLFTTFRRRGWWALSIPVAALAFAWVLIWAWGGHFKPADAVFMGLFILAISAVIFTPAALAATVVTASLTDTRQIPEGEGARRWLNLFTAGAAVTLMAFVVNVGQFGLMEWGLFALLSLGCMAMAWFRPSEFRYLPMATMGMNILMLLDAKNQMELDSFARLTLGFALLYAVPAFVLLKRAPTLVWAGLLSAAALAFYGFGYFTLGASVYPLLNMTSTETLHFWSALATMLALFFGFMTAEVLNKFEGDPALRDRLLALFCLVTTAFVSVALTIEVHRDFLGVAFAGEILAVAWVYSRLNIHALRHIAGILFGIFVLLISPQLLLLSSITVHTLTGMAPDFWRGGMPPLAMQPLFQLGLPMALLGGASWFMRLRGDGKLVELFEMMMVALGALMLYYLARHAFKVPADIVFRKAGFMERGIITNIFFAAALGVVYAGREFSRRALLWAGTALFCMAIFRVVFFDFFIANPLWASGQNVGNIPLFNWLFLPYLLPLVWLWLEERPQLRMATVPAGLRGGVSLVMIFTYVTFLVRQAYHGAYLDQGRTTSAEVYTYSAVWLILGASLLFLGTLRKNKSMRVASLGIMILTVGKVFLYDIEALTGLYRVFSFLGLGASLLALSWFYSRFVFKKEE